MGNQVGGIPADGPAFETAKSAQIIRSDIDYKKEMPDVTAMYKGYQTMDAATHPVITKGKHAADIVSMKKYHEDYEDEKALIYYPVHISEGYEQVKKCKEATADANYKTGLEENKKGNNFKPTDTATYAVIKGHEAATKDRLYKADYEATKMANKPLAVSNEMMLAKKLVEDTHDKYYQADAKADLQSNQLPTDAVGIAHAKATQPLQSQTAYRDADIKGTGRQDPANAFPEHAHIRQVGQTVAGFEYVKEAKKDLESVKGGPIDAPDLVRAKEAGVIRSDIEYKKEMPDVTAMYKGYQTMDAASHPVVTKGKKAAEIVSMRKYHEDYEDEKALIYYPVYISEGYEQVKKCKEAVADANYKTGLEDNKKGNSFKPTDTETYAVIKGHEAATKDRLYKSAYEAEKHKNKPLADSNEMQLARKLVADTHDKYYKAAAQADFADAKIDTSAVHIAHAQATQPLQSQTAYRDADIKGTGRQDPANAFPEHAHIRQVGQTVAGFEYVKDAKKDLESVKGGPID